MTRFRRTIAAVLSICLTGTSFMHGAQAAVIGIEQVAAAQSAAVGSDGHARLSAVLDRGDVVAALRARGVDPAAARERVAALTDAEADALAAQIDRAPAGGDVLGTIVFIFVLLLVTDILGFTKVYPFTRSIR
jgi:hypothetical protein